MRVFVNAGNVVAAGPRAVIARLLPALGRADSRTHFIVTVPDLAEFRELPWPHNMDVMVQKRAAERDHDRAGLRRVLIDLPRTLRATSANVCLTLGDIGPIAPPCAHVIFLHRAFLVYSDEEVAGLHAWGGLKKRYLRWHFGRSARRSSRIIVQTPVMADRLMRTYGIAAERIACIPQPPPHQPDPVPGPEGPRSVLRTAKPGRLLFLAAYYPHKNHAMLPAIAASLRRRGLSDRVHIFTTIAGGMPDADALLAVLQRDSDVITNIGSLTSDELRRAWQEATGLFLPTAVESFGLPYLEAMAFGRPILTSQRDFARWMCGNLATYFEPLDAESAADAIQAHVSRLVPPDYAASARRRLAEFPKSWDEVAGHFLRVLHRASEEHHLTEAGHAQQSGVRSVEAERVR